MKHLQRHLLVLLLALPGVASFAGEAADSLYIFRFVQGKDAFYAPWRDNSAQLEALLTLLRAHREAILSGSIPVRVDGYCTGQAPDEENRLHGRRAQQPGEVGTYRTGRSDGSLLRDRQPCRGVRRRSAECSDREAVHPRRYQRNERRFTRRG